MADAPLRLPISDADSELLHSLFDPDVHKALQDMIHQLDTCIQDRYPLIPFLTATAIELHTLQDGNDQKIRDSDIAAITGGSLAVAGLVGLLLGPIGATGEAVIFAIELAQGAGGIAQLAGETAALAYTTKNLMAAEEAGEKIQARLKEDKADLDRLGETQKRFEVTATKAYANVSSAMQQLEPDKKLPTYEEYKHLVFTMASFEPEDFNEMMAFAKDGGAKAFSTASTIAGNVQRVTSLVWIITSVFLRMKDSVKLWNENRAMSRIVPINVEEGRALPSLASVLGVSEGETQTLVGAIGGEPEVAERVARNALEYEDPGYLARRIAKAGGFNVKNVQYGFGVVSLGLTAYSLGTDIDSLIKAQSRIGEKKWSDAALEIQRVRIRLEAQLLELIRFRASFDYKRFERPYLFIKNVRSGKYLSISEHPISALGDLYGVIFETLEDSHLLNLNAQFSGLPTQYGDVPILAEKLVHRLSGMELGVWFTTRRMELYASLSPSDEKFKYILPDPKMTAGRIAIESPQTRGACDAIKADADPIGLPDGYTGLREAAAVEEEAKGNVIPAPVNYQYEEHVDNYGMKIIPGCDPHLLYVPTLGILTNDRTQTYLTVTGPDETLQLMFGDGNVLDAFGLVDSQCLQHRFTLKCLNVDPASQVFSLDTKPQENCTFDVGEVKNGYFPIHHIMTGLYLGVRSNPIILDGDGGPSFDGGYDLILTQEQQLWQFRPIPGIAPDKPGAGI